MQILLPEKIMPTIASKNPANVFVMLMDGAANPEAQLDTD